MMSKDMLQPEFEDFYMPFGGKLRSDNRWVMLSKRIPWGEFEEEYATNFANSGQGAPALPVRVALGALIIKEKLQLSDAEAVLQIEENPYLQHFLGYQEYSEESPFDSSMYVHFRKRLGENVLSEINDAIVQKALKEIEKQKRKDDKSDDDNEEPPSHKGKLLIDATCTPADIAYPTDLGLLNKAREKTEGIIDTLHKPLRGIKKKPRTYRCKARKLYLSVSKKKSPGRKKIRGAIRKQLGFLRRNLEHIDTLSEKVSLGILTSKQYRDLLVIHELFRQQELMFNLKVHSVDDRIVNIAQPHIRPIVRGKAKAKTEFGAKISAAVVDGFAYVDRISFDAYNESRDLSLHIEAYKKRYGYYPKSVHADKIYVTRENRKYCKQLKINLSGPKLGRKKKETAENKEQLRTEKKQLRQDEIDRIPIEGKFGQGKRRFGLGLIMTKLAQTTKTAISISFIVMNLEKWLKVIFYAFIFQVDCMISNAINTIRDWRKLIRDKVITQYDKSHCHNDKPRAIRIL